MDRRRTVNPSAGRELPERPAIGGVERDYLAVQ